MNRLGRPFLDGAAKMFITQAQQPAATSMP